MENTKKQIIEIGKLLWEKDLVSASAGNISLKQGNNILITTHNSCLGFLSDEDMILMDLNGNSSEKKEPTAEKPIHLAIHKNFTQAAIIHVHPPYTNGYFAVQDKLDCLTFESRLLLGDVPCIKQETPSITNLESVIAALKNSNIVVLKNHGVIAIGENLTDAFFLIQLLEEAVKVNTVAQLYLNADLRISLPDRQAGNADSRKSNSNLRESAFDSRESALKGSQENISKFEMFSDEHIKAIVDLVNQSQDFLTQAKATALRTKLAVKMDENGKVFCFTFDEGKITEVSNSDTDAEFVISGPSEYWRKIFNRELDPFVATTQKKLKLKGDFGKISRWYAPFNKLFEVWRKVGVK